jgi:hypothetical protein
VAGGLTSAQVAGKLVVAPATVNTHLRNIYRKIGVNTRGAAVRWAVEHGLVRPFYADGCVSATQGVSQADPPLADFILFGGERLGPPELVDGGHQRFQLREFELEWSCPVLLEFGGVDERPASFERLRFLGGDLS